MTNQQDDSILPISQMPNPTGRLYSHHDEDGNTSYSTNPPSSDQHTPPKQSSIKKKPRKWSNALRVFLFLLITSTLGLSYYLFHQMIQIGEHVEQKPITVTQQRSITKPVDSETDNTALQQQIQTWETKQQNLQQTLSEQKIVVDTFINTLQQQINSLETRLMTQNEETTTLKLLLEQKLSIIPNIEQNLQQLRQVYSQQQITPDWTLNEIDYLLNLAQYRLQFMQDAQTALNILNLIKIRLQDWSQPQLIQPLIAQVEQDITALNTTQVVNITKVAQQLSTHIDQVEQLIIVKAATPPPANSTSKQTPRQIFSTLESWGDVSSVVWNEIKQLITISYNENVDVGLLTEPQLFFIKENLRLKLESARLALLKSDFVTFRNVLDETVMWLQQFYDQNSTQVTAMQTNLQQLSKQSLAVTYPNMEVALNILQRIKTVTKNVH